jgi:hypothetical protein
MAADHEAVMALAQVAFRIKVPHAGLGAAAQPPLQEICTHLDVRLQGNAEKLARLARDWFDAAGGGPVDTDRATMRWDRLASLSVSTTALNRFRPCSSPVGAAS